MRKLLLYSLLAALLAVTATAQESPVDKGSIMIGGTMFNRIGISGGHGGYEADDLYEQNGEVQLTYLPSLGYFMSPGFMIGVDMLLDNDGYSTVGGIGPSVRIYFNPKRERAEIKGAIYPYIRAFMLFLAENGHSPFKSFGGGAGINYMLSRGVSVDFGIRYSSDSGHGSPKGSTLGVGAGIQAFVF